MTMLVLLDDSAGRHLARALEAHGRWCRTNRVPFPPDLARLADALAAPNGLERTQGDDPVGGVDAAPVPLLLDPEDAARQLSVSERTLRRLARDGDVKAVHIGRSVRFAPEDLAAFVEERRTEGDT